MFGDLQSSCGLQTLNYYLATRSYVSGYTPSSGDAEVYSCLAGAPPASFPHALRWYRHITALGVELRLHVQAAAASAPSEPVPDTLPATEASPSISERDVPSTATQHSEAETKCTKKSSSEDEEEFDLFGSDDDDEMEESAAKRRQELLDVYAQKKANKPGPIAKSSVMLDVKPWDDETDMQRLEETVRQITPAGLTWGASKLVPLAFGIQKLSILCTVEDEMVSVDDLVEKICENEEFVQSVDIAAFNKI